MNEHLSGEYGPKFIGYEALPRRPFIERAVPWLIGLAIWAGSLAIMLLTGSL